MQMYDAGIALTGFSCFVTPDLARDLANDVMNLVSTIIMYGHHYSQSVQTVCTAVFDHY